MLSLRSQASKTLKSTGSRSLAKRSPLQLNWKGYATSTSHDAANNLRRTRNIGIIAHIDAGKTTTTERMLYYSGYTRRIGDVDDGSTVTDFLPAERARGITIQSAAITFHWPPLPSPHDHGGDVKATSSGQPSPTSHTINLIDTPGHADFTFEVLRSLRILDGAVCILDGVAGVEAQTEKVWYQAQAYNIPKLIYINKLDREGAAFGRTVKEIAAKLHVYPAVCQIPWFADGRGEFCGVVDIVNLRAMRWEGGDGKRIKIETLAGLESVEPELAKQAQKARVALVELLSEHDDQMVDAFLDANEDHLAVPAASISVALRKILLDSLPVVPVFAGASFRNIGVQPVIDAVTDLLPSPEETQDPLFTAGSNQGGLRDLVDGKITLNSSHINTSKKAAKKVSAAQPSKIEACALAFKVVNDPKRGVLVYVRVYQGSLNKGTNLYNTNLQVSERVPRLFRMYANDAVEIDSIQAGQIGVITGLKHARTGDTLVTYVGMNPKSGPPFPLNELQLRPIEVPPPVFFASIVPNSLAEQKSTEEALAVLLREDPSLQLSVDEESGQTHLSGMGELHLEIARDRLINDMKAKCFMGKIEIGFRETITATSTEEHVYFDREIAGRTVKAGCTSMVEPATHQEFVAEGSHQTSVSREGNTVILNLVDSNASNIAAPSDRESDIDLPAHLDFHTVQQALQNGALSALARGPQHAFPLYGIRVRLTIDVSQDLFDKDTTPAALSSAARLATQAALRKSNASSPTGLMEPVMNVLITVTEDTLGSVVHDLTSARGGHIISLESGETAQHVQSDSAQPQFETASIDLKRVYAPPDPWDSGEVMDFEDSSVKPSGNRPRTITAKVPLREMVGYLKYLRSLTKGRGTFVMNVDQFEKMNANREKLVLKEMRGI